MDRKRVRAAARGYYYHAVVDINLPGTERETSAFRVGGMGKMPPEAPARGKHIKTMAKGEWWFKFEITPWRSSPELRRCSLATRGFWIDCIAIMRDSGKATLTDTVDGLARSIGCLPSEADACVQELKRTRTADVTLRNDFVTLKSRKFARELKAKELSALRVAKFREKRQCNADVTDRVRSKSKKEEKELPTEVAKEAPPPLRKQIGRLTRIPEPFDLTPERWAWLVEHGIELDDPNAAHANFVEHWTNAAPGKGEKINWELTWQKGMRLAKKWQDEDKPNGTDRNGGPTNFRRQRESDAIAEIEYIENIRQRVNARTAGISGSDADSRGRLLPAVEHEPATR